LRSHHPENDSLKARYFLLMLLKLPKKSARESEIVQAIESIFINRKIDEKTNFRRWTTHTLHDDAA
jgi:hypothetical protein